MSSELLDDLQSSLERQLGQVLKPEKSAKKSLSEEMEMLHLKAATIPPMQHARTLPPLNSDGHILDLRAGGLVKK